MLKTWWVRARPFLLVPALVGQLAWMAAPVSSHVKLINGVHCGRHHGPEPTARAQFNEWSSGVDWWGRLRAAAIIVLALLSVALASGWHSAAEIRRLHSEAQRLTREQWLSQGVKNPHSAAHFGIFAFKPKTPLAFFDPGVDPYVGVLTWLEAHKQNEFRYRPARDATAIGRIGRLTAAGILQGLVPLLILMLTFGAIAGERERGTLPLVVSQGVPLHQVLLGKAIGVAGALGALLVPVACLGAAALALSPALSPSETLARIALLAAANLMYFAAFIGAGLVISAWSRGTSVALAASVAVWIVAVLLVPRATGDLARWLHPTPSAFAFSQAVARDMAQGINGHDPADQRLEDLRKKLLQEHRVSRVRDLPVDWSGVALQAGEDYGNQVFDARYAELHATYRQQITVYEWAGALSPTVALRNLSMGLAGTDWQQHRHFALAGEAWRRHMVRQMNDEVIYRSRSDDYGTNLRGPDVWASVPDFTYTPPGPGFALRNHAASAAALGLWTVLIAIGWSFTARRVRVVLG